MVTYKAGHRVGKGTYWNATNGQRVDVLTQAVLPGRRQSTYIRMSSGSMLVWGPVAGLFYAILMPFIGIATAAVIGARSFSESLYSVAVKSVSFGWKPRNAYLSGKKEKKDDYQEPLGHC